MGATLKDIAREAKVNVATVSYVLNNKPKAMTFKNETRENIFRIAEELNYQPNAAAKALSTKKTNNIGFILSDQIEGLWENPYWAQMLTGVEETCRRNNIGLLINAYNLSNIDSFIYPRQLEQSSVDGLILTGHIPDSIIEKFRSSNIPFICLGDDLEVARNDVITYSFDMESVMLQAILSVCEYGHRKIAMTVPNTQAQKRTFLSLCKAVDRLPFHVELTPVDLPTPECNQGAVDEIYHAIFSMDGQSRPTVLLTTVQACQGMLIKLRECGRRCPDDLSLVCIFGSPGCKYTSPALSRIDFDLKRLSMAACEGLIQLINGKTVSRMVVKDNKYYSIVIGGSCMKLR